MQIRRYKAQDTDTLAAIYHDTIHNINKNDYTPEELEAWAPTLEYTEEKRQKDTERWRRINPFVVVADSDVPLGFAELEEEGYINCFYVRHDSIGKGAGSMLLAACISEAKRLGYGRVFASVSITARPFFLKQGFRVVKPELSDVRGLMMKFYEMEKYI